MDVSKFNEKLNKLDGQVHVIEEVITPINGVYEAELIHDNVNLTTLNVYTGSKLTGDKINTVSLSTPSLTPWKTVIKIFSTISPLYISYETTGDQVEAEDINRLQDAVVDTQENLNSEIDRAKGAEKVLTDNLNSEITRAKNAEQILTNNLANEVNRSTNAEKVLTDNLNAEISRAKSSENTITNNLNSEITRAKVAEETLADNLDSEIIRAKNAEQTLTNNLASEVSRAKSSEGTLTDNLNAEITRAKGAEQILTDDLNSEVDRATQNENTLANNLSSEIQRAIQSENSIKGDINANRANWNDAYNKRHIHNNKSILDNLGENTGGELTFKGSKIVSTTVNGLTDDVNIAGGNNITISKEGNTIVVSAAGGQEKIVTNTPITILSTDWVLDTTVTPNIYKATIQHNLNDSNIIVSVYNGSQVSELVGIRINDLNTIILSNYEPIDCRIVINSSGQPTEVIDNLDSSESNKALSAKQGKILKDLISSVEGGILIGDTLANAQQISLFLKIIG